MQLASLNRSWCLLRRALLVVFALGFQHSSTSRASESNTALLEDGSRAAAKSSIQRPRLFDKYILRPPWKVAGVDYAVGVAAISTLRDWRELKGPGISSVNYGGQWYVRVDDTAGAHIDGVDFSLYGGANLSFVNSPGGIVTNCNFKSDVSSGIIATDVKSPGLTLKYSTIDGTGSGPGSTLIFVLAGGDVILQYNWFKNFPAHVLEMNYGGNLDYRFNLIENGGMERGAHLNYLQFGGAGSASARVEFNTTYQLPQAAGPGEGFQFYFPGGTLRSPTFAYNTMISDGRRSMSYLLHGSSGQVPETTIAGKGSVHHNYFDASGTYSGGNDGVFYPGSFVGWEVYSNWNLVSGKNVK